MSARSPSPSPQIRATATTTTANRQIWSSVSMSMHHRTSTTTTAATLHEKEEEFEDGHAPVFSRDTKTASPAASSTLASPSSLPPPYTPHPPSLTPKPEGQHTKSSSWRFEIALEGGTCVIKQLGHPAASHAVPTEEEGGAMGVLACLKALFSIVAGTVMAFVGVIVSILAVLVTYVLPSMAARAPEAVARPSDNSTLGSRKRKLSPAVESSTSLGVEDRRILSPSDLTLVSSTSTGAVSSLSTSPVPVQRHVTFNLDRTAAASVSSAGKSSNVDMVALNTPTVNTFPPTDDDEEKDVSEMGVVPRAATTLSTTAAATATPARGKKRRNWFMGRRAAALGSASDVDDSSDAGTMGTNSAPPTPSTLVTELPPVSEEEAGSGSAGKTAEKEAKSGRRISLKLQFNGRSWKRRSGSSSVETPSTAGSAGVEDGSTEGVAATAEVTSPSSTLSSGSAQLPIPPTSKQQKRRSFPFVGSSASSSLCQPQPTTAPARPTARTNPYGAPYFAAPPTARLPERRRGSYDVDTGAHSDRESRHRRAESEDGSARPTAVRQDSMGSAVSSRGSSSLTSGTGSGSGLGLEGTASGVSEMGELQPAPPTSPPPPPKPTPTKKTTSPYAKPRLPSTSPLASAAGRVASDSSAIRSQSQKNAAAADRKRTSSASNRPPVVDRHARMRDAALAWASDSDMPTPSAGRSRSGSTSGVRAGSGLRE